MYVCVKSLYLMICCISGKNGFTPPGLVPGLSDCQSDALPTELQRETSFHLLCVQLSGQAMPIVKMVKVKSRSLKNHVCHTIII